LSLIELFFDLFLSVVVIPSPGSVGVAFGVVAFFLELAIMVVELPFSGT
jgi:hypothetical protein